MFKRALTKNIKSAVIRRAYSGYSAPLAGLTDEQAEVSPALFTSELGPTQPVLSNS